MRRSSLFALATVLSLASAKPTSQFSAPLADDQKIAHALNRLTFGPRPGDFEQIQAMGLKKWIDLQLHPDRIAENPDLATKLAPLDTLRMTPLELAWRYPPPQLIKDMVDGKIPFPKDPETLAMIDNAVRRIKSKQGNESDEKPTLENVGLTEEQQRILRRGAPAEKLKVFDGLLDEQKDQVLEAMPQPARIGLFSVAPPDLRRRIQKSGGPQFVITQDLMEAKLLRAIYSNRQLDEVLTDFWYNHFNVFLDKGADRYLVGSYERDVIRPHVLGKFEDLLVATAQSPAMLFYLDNVQSVDPRAAALAQQRRGVGAAQPRQGLNENYARELMELHTLGVDGGYTQRDVTEVARCFTGWSIKAPREGATFVFRERMHDNGPKIVLGVRIPPGGGIEDGMRVLHILAHHPSTARFISRKLAMRFVADEPPPSLIARMARTFREKDGDLRAVMQTMLASPEFWSQGAYRVKMKSPLEMVASSVRALGADVDFSFALSQQLVQLGQPLYRKQEPTGYTNAGQEWMNSASLPARMNFAIALAGNRIPGVKVDAARFGDAPDTDRIAAALMLTGLSEEARTAIEAGLAAQADTQNNDGKRRPKFDSVPKPLVIAGLMLGSPDFQRR
jgi:uncharacterized protein (DUF1800 family)